ncbi:MAG: AI-2E family transporter, partial [Antricoccus sp.]
VVSTTGSILSGTLLTLLTTYFFLADGSSLWRWIARLFPVNARWKVYRAGNRAWEVLVAYMNVTLLVAIIVGLATWIACKIAGVPLSLSAGLIAFLFAFIPTLGGLISSIVVILLTLVSTSLTTAVVIAIVMISIQTIQGNFIYPLLMNRQLKVHPLASLLLVVLGAVLGGVFGALIAVPLVAVINSGWLELLRANRGEAESDEAAELGPDPAENESDPTLRDPTTASPMAEPDLTD